MRRHDREVTDPAKIDEILSACDCCRVAFSTEGAPYIVPLNFGFTRTAGRRILYFHGAKAGQKLELARRGGAVGFELDRAHQVLPTHGDACAHTFGFQSIIGTGRIQLVEDDGEKARALRLIRNHYSPEDTAPITPAMTAMIAVFRIDVEVLTCKWHQ